MIVSTGVFESVLLVWSLDWVPYCPQKKITVKPSAFLVSNVMDSPSTNNSELAVLKVRLDNNHNHNLKNLVH